MDFGLPEASAVAGIAVVPAILDRVFGFVSKQKEADRQAEVLKLMSRQTDLMERLTPMIEAIHRTTDTYEKAGVCPLTKPEGRESVARTIGKEIKSKD